MAVGVGLACQEVVEVDVIQALALKAGPDLEQVEGAI